MTKKPNFKETVSNLKKPRTASNPDNYDRQSINWQVSLLDYDFEFGWLKIDKETLKEKIIESMKAKEKTTWHEIKSNGKSHNVPINDLIKPAQHRLEELKLLDAGEIFSLRLNNLERIWGIKDGATLKILWWDPEHKICPSSKSHT